MSVPAPRPFIPESITVHLGRPDANVGNVTVSFTDYIKNVASSEIYPTWDRNAILANIYAQISFALNRVYLEYYPSRGYAFQITNSTAFDQSFHYGRNFFENISQLVDEVFDEYIRRQGVLEPLAARYCNGTTVTCEGLSQWGSQNLAEQGLGTLAILRNYYGNDIELVVDAPVQGIRQSYPGSPLSRGSVGPSVSIIQYSLNRVSLNYPAIPKINPVDGIFGSNTEEAVRAFQRIFGLTADGIVGKATWYKLVMLYVSLRKLSELESEGLQEFVIEFTPVSANGPNDVRAVSAGFGGRTAAVTEVGGQLTKGDTGENVRGLQAVLAVLSEFYAEVPPVEVTGVYGNQTAQAVLAVQRLSGLPLTGTVDAATRRAIYDRYLGVVQEVFPRPYTQAMQTQAYPGTPLQTGSRGESVRTLQQYLNAVGEQIQGFPVLTETGVFGPLTAQAVRRFQTLAELPVTGVVNEATWNAVADAYRNVLAITAVLPLQYPGYPLRQGMRDSAER